MYDNISNFDSWINNLYYLFSELAVILWSEETKFGEGKMGAFWYTTVGWGWLNGMKYSTMPWQVSGSRRTATHFCVETRFMTVGMVESVSSVGGRVSSHQYWEICKTVRIYDYKWIEYIIVTWMSEAIWVWFLLQANLTYFL